MKDDYKFDCKIPTCQQLEPKKDKPDSKSRQLTVKQTSDTKIVTKVTKIYIFQLIVLYFIF